MADVGLATGELVKLRALLGSVRGVDLSYYTSTFLARRIHNRMKLVGCAGPSEYIARLERDRPELEAFIASLTINVTEFFRNEETYESLRRRVLPQLLAASRRVEAWSAGCATGEEPYALAMLLDDAAAGRRGYSYVVHASDISPNQLRVAQEAVYPVEAARRAPKRYFQRYFVDRGDGRVTVCPSLRSQVRFHQYDLSSGQPPPAPWFDLILCRNVMIYFSPQAKEKLLALFHRVLRPGGFLVLGGSELILHSELFSPFDAKSRIYQVSPPALGGGR